MQEADFQYLVRCSEQDAEADPDGFLRKVMLFAALGLLYVLFTLIAGGALLYFAYELLAGKRQIFSGLMLGSLGVSMLLLALPSPPSRRLSYSVFCENCKKD